MAQPPVSTPGEWSTGLFEFADECGFCCLATWCGCFAYGMNSAQIKQGGDSMSWEACTYYTCFWCFFVGGLCDNQCTGKNELNPISLGVCCVSSPLICLFAPLTNKQANFVGKQRKIPNGEVCCIDENCCPSIWCWPCVLTRLHKEIAKHPSEIKGTFKSGDYTPVNSMFASMKLSK